MMRDSEGFTLVELSVAVVLTLLVAAAAFAAFDAVRRLESRWSERLAAENAAHLIATTVAGDLLQTNRVMADSAGSWTLQLPSGRMIRYDHRTPVLTRNGTPMNVAPVEVTTFDLSVSNDSAASPVQPQVSVANFTVDVATGRDTLHVVSSAAMRPPEPWGTLPHPDLTHVP